MHKTTVDNDTTAKLWDKRYEVRYPFHATRTIEDIAQNGTYISGLKDVDNNHAKELIVGSLTVVDIITLVFDKGVTVRFVHRPDVDTIYNDIRAHLEAWQKFSQTSYNHNPEVYDDLLKFDQFAELLFNNYVRFDPDRKNKIHSEFARKLLASNIFSDNVLANLSNKSSEEAIVVASQDEYPSLSGFLRSKILLKGIQ